MLLSMTHEAKALCPGSFFRQVNVYQIGCIYRSSWVGWRSPFAI